MEFPWYQTLINTNDIQQGDFIPDCPIAILPVGLNPDDEIEMDIRFMNVIIFLNRAI